VTSTVLLDPTGMNVAVCLPSGYVVCWSIRRLRIAFLTLYPVWPTFIWIFSNIQAGDVRSNGSPIASVFFVAFCNLL
jgi:hypothetical protein